MLKTLDSYDWEEAFAYADFNREDVAEIAGYDDGENASEEWIIYGHLNDGDWFLLAAW